MLDFLERQEKLCEDWEFENVKGNNFRCCCGRWEKLENGETLSVNPYSIPVCTTCFKNWWRSKYENTRKN
ncbi:MAG: hypothetical protein ACFFG0_27390 [Candidatus Thorarchaeota archaeon]